MQGKEQKQLAVALRTNRAPLSRALFAAVFDSACASWKSPPAFEHLEEWGHSQLLTAVELLAARFERDDTLYRELFAGWLHSRLFPGLTTEPEPADLKRDALVNLAAQRWSEILDAQISLSAAALLREELLQVSAILAHAARRLIRVLFIGDCLQFEVMTALVAPSAAAQIDVKSTLVNERVQAVLRNRIRTFAPDQFDLVFFSPFSHAYLPEYEALLSPRSSTWGPRTLRSYVDAMLAEVRTTLHTLADQLDCPIYVHNTAATIQSFALLTGAAKNLLSWWSRRRCAGIINAGIASDFQQPHVVREARLHLLDEADLRRRSSPRSLGRVYFNSFAYHPTRLGIELGLGAYFDTIFARAMLAGRKVVICDLDNTLWDGVIGEGPVAPFVERQSLLKELRTRGVLLSIASRNDARNVHWTDSTLQADDFVAARINWDSKPHSVAAICDQLNLKPKDFVFLDDRRDELERVGNAFPEILTLDARQPRTWRFLARWKEGLTPEPDEDRTRLYHERAKRDGHIAAAISDRHAAIEDESAALHSLQIRVSVKDVGRSGLKRAAELVNRTNQFNLCGSRTSERELRRAIDEGSSVMTCEVCDKFGNLGVVGVMRVDRKPDRIEIPMFVLSCRAFGFGIERALLNSIRDLTQLDLAVVGHFRPTQFNEPCRRLYPESGFTWDGQFWTGRLTNLGADPAWLTVRRELKPARTPAQNSVQG